MDEIINERRLEFEQDPESASRRGDLLANLIAAAAGDGGMWMKRNIPQAVRGREDYHLVKVKSVGKWESCIFIVYLTLIS